MLENEQFLEDYDVLGGSDDNLGEECGVFGIYNNDNNDSGQICYYALFALQHRGQQSCGIAVTDDTTVKQYKDMGIIPEVFDDKEIVEKLTGKIAVGHVRYSAFGDSFRQNAQPLVSRYIKGTLSISHNGKLVNATELREQLEKEGMIFQTTIDSEIVAALIAKERIKCASIEDAVCNMMEYIKGAYTFVIMSPKKLIGCRDPHGIRPLCIGKLENSYVISSESCAIEAIGGKFIRDVEPGEVVVIDENGLRSIKKHCNKVPSSLCIFEHIYFARPDSFIDGVSVYESRKEAGRQLAKQHPVEGDLVFGVPDSGLDAAIGYAEESGIPFGLGLVKNRYIGRTFIKPTQSEREDSVRVKLNAIRASVEGKRVIMIDDSIVRGTTVARLVKILKSAGAKEVHMRVCSPPFMHLCYYGTDIPSKDKLIANRYPLDKIAEVIGVDSLGFLSTDSLKEIVKGSKLGFCDACFTGKYPTDIPKCVENQESDQPEIAKSANFTLL